MTTAAYIAKKAVIDRLKFEVERGSFSTIPGYDNVNGLTVHYAEPIGDPGLWHIYGGGVRFGQNDLVEEPNILVSELTDVSLYVRIMARPPVPIEETDDICARIAAVVGAVFKDNPALPGIGTFVKIAGGMGDYFNTDNESGSILGLQLQVRVNVAYG